MKLLVKIEKIEQGYFPLFWVSFLYTYTYLWPVFDPLQHLIRIIKCIRERKFFNYISILIPFQKPKINLKIDRDYYFIDILVWEPCVARGTHSYSRCLPALGWFFTEKQNFRYSLPNLFRISKAKTIPVAFPSSPIKIWGKSVKGFLINLWIIVQSQKFEFYLKSYETNWAKFVRFSSFLIK